MFGAEVDVDDASAFVGGAHRHVFVTVLVYVTQIAQRKAESENENKFQLNSQFLNQKPIETTAI